MMKHCACYKFLLFVLLLAALPGCIYNRWNPRIHPPDQLPETNSEGTLKLHLTNGDLVVLTSWQEDTRERILRGTGTRYDARRNFVSAGAIELPAETILLGETQVLNQRFLPGYTLFTAYATIMTAITIECVNNPKACFGSCPTFYTGDDPDWPVAEGFSSSVARAMEERDIDALWHARPTGSRFEITMRNEAMETHAVRHLRLLTANRPDNGRVLATGDGRFYPARNLTPPNNCTAAEGTCLEAVRYMDRSGRVSPADSSDLAAREVIELEFTAPNPSGGQPGLVIGARHTFISTHIFYQMLAWLGHDAAEMLVMLESGTIGQLPFLFDALREMGEIRVSVKDSSGAWRQVGIYDEAGPIATDIQVIPLGDVTPGKPVQVRLDLNKGFWRVDYLALADLGSPVEPVTLNPGVVFKHTSDAGEPGLSRPDRQLPDGVTTDVAEFADTYALSLLLHPDHYLYTYPGDEYRIRFELPGDGQNLELFLDSQGFYYEWMRREWLDEQDPQKAFQLLWLPGEALKKMAPVFKQHEAGMEELFWQSRIRRMNP